MTISQLIKNIKFSNLLYIVQSKYRAFINKEYNRIYSDTKLNNMLYAAATCSECYLNGSCLECGCDFKEMITSDKPCPKNKW